MAEVLGLASGIITVVETAGKLGSAALRLKRLWDEIQDVPDMIKLHMERLQMLAPALDDMQDQFRHTRAVVERDVAAQQSLEYCRKAFATLESLVIDLGKQIASSKKGKRTMAKFKVVLKKTTIQGYERQLEYAMDLAVFSQQSYMIALNRAQHSIVMSEFKALRTLQYLREPRKSRAVEEESDGDELPDSQALTQQVATRYAAGMSSRPRVKKNQSTPLGSQKWFTYEISEVSDEGLPVVTSQVYNARFRLPLWFIEKVWDFQIHKSYMGWKFDLKSWCIRPWNSPIFRHAMVGDIEQVLAAFSANEASLYDQDECGRNLLDLATVGPQIELSKRLIHLGLRWNENEAARFMDDKGCFEADLLGLLDPDCEVSISTCLTLTKFHCHLRSSR